MQETAGSNSPVSWKEYWIMERNTSSNYWFWYGQLPDLQKRHNGCCRGIWICAVQQPVKKIIRYTMKNIIEIIHHLIMTCLFRLMYSHYIIILLSFSTKTNYFINSIAGTSLKLHQNYIRLNIFNNFCMPCLHSL